MYSLRGEIEQTVVPMVLGMPIVHRRIAQRASPLPIIVSGETIMVLLPIAVVRLLRGA